ncbi:MAG TPA: SdrD B-like domain-containing protein [Methanolinea sp.]|nr:SdrD B-like domain-containing protein [Methanolinea sp.]
MKYTWKVDLTPPTVNCPDDAYGEFGDSKHRDNTGYATAEDNCDGVIPVSSYTDGPVTPSTTANCYSYVRNWSAVDECGNIGYCEQVIHVQSSSICGMKYYDANINGVKDAAEVAVKGVTIQLYNSTGALIATKVTSADGKYCFNHLKLGIYTVKEVLPSGATWIGTSPTSLSVTLDTYGVVSDGHNFGNICLGEGNGRTLGFWSNENGQALITPAMLTGLNNLPLENAADRDQNFASKTDFRNLLLRGTASSNMGYKLSTQLAAMYLK